MKKIFNWTTIRLILMFGLVIFLFSFTSKRNEKRKLAKIDVVFVGENNLFVKEETVNKLLIENMGDPLAIEKDKLDLNKLEGKLNSNAMIDESDVFVSINGVLKAVVKQKTPVARVINGSESFYIDYKGGKMPLSDNFTARVPLVSGDINKGNKEKWTRLLRVIYEDDFLRKNIIAIEIMPNESLKMFNRNYDYLIDFGSMMNFETKFKNYKAFFQKAVLDSTLYKYKKIDLRFTKQVVCTK
ncbi:cell division protein FtsQ [Flavobacterium palustre]|uniref:Cell division protein FtsQ n=1 Tax=Flavobacterium palustre TaxID=1476463 RepID=A0ABQ1H837_9FLAO|nr:cell division protein FtsQ [Flavobacterium palustre]GGA63970.1 cell division protein FtsQ [Flavobacterium palustre]